MSDPTSIAREGLRGLGAGAYLVTALPSAVLVVTITALVSSRLYPFMEPLTDAADQAIEPGVPSILVSVASLGVAGGVLLVLTIACIAVVLRPLQISLVQLLEGYWGSRGRRGWLAALATERHLRHRSRAWARASCPEWGYTSHRLSDVALTARRNHHMRRLEAGAAVALGRYPADHRHVMPTALGNVLRRMESRAGERYGLSTATVFPRLYPHLSRPLETEMASQVDALDSTATFSVIFMLQGIAAAPLLLRADRWAVVPIVFIGLSAISYLGSVRAASRYGDSVEVAFDLHRFDLLASLRLDLPSNPRDEAARNAALSEFLAEPTSPSVPHLPDDWVYAHAETADAASTLSGPPSDDDGPNNAYDVEHHDG